jgi:hypothetical protein
MPKLLNAGQSPFGWHRIQAFMQCPTKYYHSYISEEHTRTVSPSLIVGSLLHTGMAHRYAIMSYNGEDHDLFDPVSAMKEQARQEGELWIEQLPKVLDVYERYTKDKYVQLWELGVEVLYIEDVFTMTIEGYDLTLRADLVIKDKNDGKIYFVDHKTSSYVQKTTTQGYQSSGQFIAYQVLGEQLWGDDFGGLLINYLQHGGFRAKTPTVKFIREKTKRSQQHMDAFAPSVLFYRRLIEMYQDKPLKHFPRVQTEFTCMHKYGACDHYDKCFNNNKLSQGE